MCCQHVSMLKYNIHTEVLIRTMLTLEFTPTSHTNPRTSCPSEIILYIGSHQPYLSHKIHIHSQTPILTHTFSGAYHTNLTNINIRITFILVPIEYTHILKAELKQVNIHNLALHKYQNLSSIPFLNLSLTLIFFILPKKSFNLDSIFFLS